LCVAPTLIGSVTFLAAANVFSSLLARVVSHHLLSELFDFGVLGFGRSHLPSSTSAIPP
jgi:hypothetical protein